MRIALYENLIAGGGAKRAAFELTRALTAHGHVVDHWTTTAADTMFLPLERVTDRHFRFPWPEHRPLPRRLPGLRGYLEAAGDIEWLERVKRLARAMAAQIDGEGYDFVFAHHCNPHAAQAPYLLRYLRTPSVYYCQEPMRTFYDPSIERPYNHRRETRLDRYQRRWYTPAARAVPAWRKREDAANARHATMLLANSYFSAESIYRAYHRRALVSYLGIDVETFRPLGLPRQDFVLSVGALDPAKGYDFLIDALGHVPAGKRPSLLIVGGFFGSERGYLQQLAAARGVALDVRQGVPDDELARLYNQARALVYAPVLEPFGLAPLEAMACGAPVVAVAEGGVRESVRDGDTGLLTQREAGHFAATLTRLLDDPALQSRLADAGVAAVRTFWTWPAAYDRFMGLVGTALPDRRAS